MSRSTLPALLVCLIAGLAGCTGANDMPMDAPPSSAASAAGVKPTYVAPARSAEPARLVAPTSLLGLPRVQNPTGETEIMSLILWDGLRFSAAARSSDSLYRGAYVGAEAKTVAYAAGLNPNATAQSVEVAIEVLTKKGHYNGGNIAFQKQGNASFGCAAKVGGTQLCAWFDTETIGLVSFSNIANPMAELPKIYEQLVLRWSASPQAR